jgi:hypothetical protein
VLIERSAAYPGLFPIAASRLTKTFDSMSCILGNGPPRRCSYLRPITLLVRGSDLHRQVHTRLLVHQAGAEPQLQGSCKNGIMQMGGPVRVIESTLQLKGYKRRRFSRCCFALSNRSS